MRLSDAFEHPMEDPEIELTCRVYNINYGRNKELLEKCPVLKEYMIFVDYVREFHRQNGYEDLANAIESAIDRCIEENVLRRFLIEHRSEVVKVTQLDYTFDRQLTLERAESREEGRTEGLAEGLAKGEEKKLIEMVCKKIQKGKSAEEIADILEEDVQEIRRIYHTAKESSLNYDCDKIYEILHT